MVGLCASNFGNFNVSKNSNNIVTLDPQLSFKELAYVLRQLAACQIILHKSMMQLSHIKIEQLEPIASSPGSSNLFNEVMEPIGIPVRPPAPLQCHVIMLMSNHTMYSGLSFRVVTMHQLLH